MALSIAKGGWNTVVGYRPQLARSGGGFVTALVLPRATRPTARTLFRWPRSRSPTPESFLRWSPPTMATALEQGLEQGLEELLGLGVKVVSISGAKGKKII